MGGPQSWRLRSRMALLEGEMGRVGEWAMASPPIATKALQRTIKRDTSDFCVLLPRNRPLYRHLRVPKIARTRGNRRLLSCKPLAWSLRVSALPFWHQHDGVRNTRLVRSRL